MSDTMSNKEYHITGFRISNILKIKTIRIDNTGKMTWIVGGNGEGKSSVILALKSIAEKMGVPPDWIHEDAEKGEVFVEFNHGEIETTSKFNQSSRQLEAVSNGARIGDPYKFLKELFPKVNFLFDPSEFFLEKGIPGRRGRYEMILQATPFTIYKDKFLELVNKNGGQIDLIDADEFDFSEHGLELLRKIKKNIYDQRTEQGRTVDQLVKSIAQDKEEIPNTFDRKRFVDFDIKKRLEDLRTAQETKSKYEGDIKARESLLKKKSEKEQAIENKKSSNANLEPESDMAIEQKKDDIEVKKKELERLERELTNLEAKKITDIKQAEEDLAQLEIEKDEILKEGKIIREKINAYIPPDTSEIQSEIAEYNDSRELVLKLEAIEDREEKLKAEKSKYQALELLYEVMTNKVGREILKQLKMPVKGMTIDDDRIYLNGKNIERLADSEQLDFSIDAAKFFAGQIKTIFCDKLEQFDPDKLTNFIKKTKNDGYNYLCTIRTKGPLQFIVDDNAALAEALKAGADFSLITANNAETIDSEPAPKKPAKRKAASKS